MLKLVDNIDTSIREYLSNNALLKKDGSIYKSVTVNNINYTFAGSHYVHNAKNVIHKNNNIVFIKNTINVSKTYIEIETGILNNLFKIRGGISIPPVEAPALITIAIATPTKTPAKSVLIKISSVK